MVNSVVGSAISGVILRCFRRGSGPAVARLSITTNEVWRKDGAGAGGPGRVCDHGNARMGYGLVGE
jgi:hypothetical protein